MQGPEMRAALRQLANDFDAIAVPEDGDYVREPARAGRGKRIGLRNRRKGFRREIPRPASTA